MFGLIAEGCDTTVRAHLTDILSVVLPTHEVRGRLAQTPPNGHRCSSVMGIEMHSAELLSVACLPPGPTPLSSSPNRLDAQPLCPALGTTNSPIPRRSASRGVAATARSTTTSGRVVLLRHRLFL